MSESEFHLEFERPLRKLQAQLTQIQADSQAQDLDVAAEMASIRARIEATQKEIYQTLTPWQRVQLARHPKRPYALDFIGRLFDRFEELHGDRTFGDDQALIGGTAWFDDQPIIVIAQQKGRDVKENLKRNFGMPHPEGYRKAMRLMEMADRFSLPILSFIDTKAAYAGVGSEERHVSEAIARNLREMATLGVPMVGVILGEGGSGGALGIAVVNRLLVLQHAYYSVIPPEGCAAILWRDRKYAETAANALQLGARELEKQGIADEVVPEPLGGAHRDPEVAAENLRTALKRHLNALAKKSPSTLRADRYEKFRKIGPYLEAKEAEARALA